MKFSAFAEGQLALKTAVLEIQTQRNERQPLFRCPSDEPSNLAAIEEKLSRSQRIVVRVGSMGVGADVAIQQPHFPLFTRP